MVFLHYIKENLFIPFSLSLFAKPAFSSRRHHLPAKSIFQPLPWQREVWLFRFCNLEEETEDKGAKKRHFSAEGTPVEKALANTVMKEW